MNNEQRQAEALRAIEALHGDLETEARRDCPHCPDGHEDPRRRPWAVMVSEQRDGDGQPITLLVGKTGLQHVSEADARWLREVIREAQGR